VLVGGSGLYLRAASRGLAPLPPADPAIRLRLQVELEAHGPQALHQRLSSVDPETAARLGPRDHPRITRALEVIESTGRPLSWWHGRRERGGIAGPWMSFELRAGAAFLRERIAARTRWMYRNGLCDETRALIERGLGPAMLELHAVGYDEAAAALAGELSLAGAEARTVLRTAQLAKRQRTWFRHQSNALPFSVDDLAPSEVADRIVARVRGAG
jgi:tRNA dimethylallyltransferase